MAIIKCPQCAKSISDKQAICPHCDLDMKDLTEEKLHSLSKIKTLKNSQTFNDASSDSYVIVFSWCFYLLQQRRQNGSSVFIIASLYSRWFYLVFSKPSSTYFVKTQKFIIGVVNRYK
jgi:hypothetical protein